MPARLLSLLAAGVLLASGCGPAKLEMEKAYTLDPGDTKTLILPPQQRPQRITVEFGADNPVEVGIYKTADISDPNAALPASKALAIKKAETSGTLVVDLGPEVGTTVTATALSKKTTVKLHLTNRK